MQQNIDTDTGGVNLAFNMSELWSIHILDIVGATQQMESGSLPKGQWAQSLICLTGVYVYSLNERKLFETGDQQSVTSFEQALTSVVGIGSPDVTQQQLVSAFQAGSQSGSPSTCGVGSSNSSSSSTRGGGTGTTTGGGGTNTAPALGATTT
jgi:hypothetical protein